MPNDPKPKGEVEQISLFETAPDWEEQWKGMPEFKQNDLKPFQTINVHFRNVADRREFAKMHGQTITDNTKYIWFPRAAIREAQKYVAEEKVDPRYPIYVISKGRADTRLTAKALEKIGVPYHIVIEPQELDAYAAVIDPAKILQLPFSNLGQGSIPARNWVWEHSVSVGAKRHWILDDNIDGFVRLHDNLKVTVTTGAMFRAAEDFTERYLNVAISGFNYRFFANQKTIVPPFYLNTRIYSCILIRNDIPYRWRGRYNEDTDLSIRALKDGHCTILFNAFLANKSGTMKMKGGNTDELYKGDGRLQMAQSLVDQHPDIVRITQKWGRYQHHVDYSGFQRNKLVLDPDAKIDDAHDNYSMKLVVGEQENVDPVEEVERALTLEAPNEDDDKIPWCCEQFMQDDDGKAFVCSKCGYRVAVQIDLPKIEPPLCCGGHMEPNGDGMLQCPACLKTEEM